MARYEYPNPLSPRQRRLRYLARRGAVLLGIGLAVLAGALLDRGGFFGQANQSDWDKYDGKHFKVVKVVDGDTLDVDCPDGRYPHTRIRLLGVDTPETKKPDTPVQYYGPEATAYTKAKTLGKVVTLQLARPKTRDKYNRLLAYVILPDGTNLDLALVLTGCGYADPRFRHPMLSAFNRAQKDARAARAGLWKGVTDADLPYYFRGKLNLDSKPAGK